MRNHSSAGRDVFCLPIELDPRFPLHATAPWRQNDAPIRRLHVHPRLELGVCHEGSGLFVVGDKVLPFRGGDVSFIGPREPHLAQSAPGTHSRWTWFYLDPPRLLPCVGSSLDPAPFAGPDFSNIWSRAEQPELNEAIHRLARELEARGEGWEEVCRATVWELMLRVRRSFGALGGETVPSSPRVSRGEWQRLAPALERLAGQPDERASGAELARACGLSEAQFRRVFRAATGRSPHDYALDVRVRMAASLLRNTSKSVLSISQEVGFSSLSSFNRAFLKTFGLAPRAWRRENG